jgi:hypothetical protein
MVPLIVDKNVDTVDPWGTCGENLIAPEMLEEAIYHVDQRR